MLKSKLCDALGLDRDGVAVGGALGQRLVMARVDRHRWTACALGPKRLGDLPLPPQLTAGIEWAEPNAPVSMAEVDSDVLHRLLRPRVVLVALYHPENFPLPRFALGISDIARALRSGYVGEVHLIDMQLDGGATEVTDRIVAADPDILGISSTFGQHDVLTEVLDRATGRLAEHVEIVFGGSLSALNEPHLLRRFPRALVARGAGEPSLIDLVAHWHGDLARQQIRSVSFTNDDSLEITRKVSNREYHDIVPELDLLDRTLDAHGVMQLESSRGCTHACSFCPRDHKGVWHGDDPRRLESIVGELAPFFDAHPAIARKVYLVDEEFIGHDRAGESLEHARRVADVLHSHGFWWETSSRVDQVYRPDRPPEWHTERIELWRYLKARGLDRCLFGVESGVDTILRRFNKKATAEQNARAVRLLTALGIPIRCTYITFDQLMTLDELIASYRFQGRRDITLQTVDVEDRAALYEAITDEAFVAEHTADIPFYAHVSCMLVSMECLVNSPYLRLVEDAGLARELLPSMGRRNAVFRDPRIGMLSEWSQRWVDRNFSFDYTLKSFEKVSERGEKREVRDVRRRLKESAYVLLGRMLYLVTLDPQLLATDAADHTGFLDEHRDSFLERADRDADELLRAVVDAQFAELLRSIERPLETLGRALDARRRPLLEAEVERWSSRQRWDLINSPEQCVT